MSMFNWQQSDDSTSSHGKAMVVSPQFWIYWAVTVPLTLITLIGWALWWNFEKRRYDIDIHETLGNAEAAGQPYSGQGSVN